jgi:predicted Fe-S protein YdhL (DUF1289 family)
MRSRWGQMSAEEKSETVIRTLLEQAARQGKADNDRPKGTTKK